MKSDTLVDDLRKFAVTLGENELPMAGALLAAAAGEIEETRALCFKLLMQLPCDSRSAFIPPGCYWLRDN